MDCRIYLVRHGETMWNASRRLQGHSDVPLSERGREQAHLLAKRLAKEKIECFYCSDLDRAMETARILAVPHGLEVSALAGLRELDFGPWEGMTFEEMQKNRSWNLREWFKNPLDNHVPGGEKLSAMVKRCDLAMENIIRKHEDETIVVVAHGGSIRCIICSVLGLRHSQMWRLDLGNTGLSMIEFPPWNKYGVIKLVNDCTHLD